MELVSSGGIFSMLLVKRKFQVADIRFSTGTYKHRHVLCQQNGTASAQWRNRLHGNQ